MGPHHIYTVAWRKKKKKRSIEHRRQRRWLEWEKWSERYGRKTTFRSEIKHQRHDSAGTISCCLRCSEENRLWSKIASTLRVLVWWCLATEQQNCSANEFPGSPEDNCTWKEPRGKFLVARCRKIVNNFFLSRILWSFLRCIAAESAQNREAWWRNKRGKKRRWLHHGEC